MNVLFLNANLYGHINPTIGLIKKIVESGHQVSYYCSKDFSKKVTEAGARWLPFSKEMDQFFLEYRPTDRHPFYMLMEYILLYDEMLLPEVEVFLKQTPYDLIISDSIFGASSFLKRMTDIPVACSHSSFTMTQSPVPERMVVPGFHPQLDHCYLILKRICDKYAISEPTLEELFVSKGERNIVYTTYHFNGNEKVNEPEYIFAGPSLDREKETINVDLTQVGDRKLIYISLGSINTNFVEFYKMCIAAFQGTEYYVCMSIGNKFEVSELGDIPDNFLVKNVFPQLYVLKQADVFITHGGFNSTNEALFYGVPLIAFPQVNDQHMVAKRILSLGLGLSESMNEMTPDILREKTINVLQNDEIRANCNKMSREMRESCDIQLAVNELEKYVLNRKED